VSLRLGRAGVAMGSALALVASLLVGFPMVASAADDDAREPAGRVVDCPALDSSTKPAASARVVEGDFSAVRDPAPPVREAVFTPVAPEQVDLEKLLGSLKESDLVSRSEFTDTFALGDGGFVDVISDRQVNVRRADGTWVPVSTRLVPGDGGLQVLDHPLSPQFSTRPDAAGSARYTRDGATVSFSLKGMGLSGFLCK
jgi:hypothetical protein